jgi:hypothetical protein
VSSTPPSRRRWIPALALAALLLAVIAPGAASAAAPVGLTVPQMDVPQSVHCVTSSRCVAVGYKDGEGGKAMVVDPLTASVFDQVLLPGVYIEDVACPSASQCSAIDAQGNAVTFNPAGPASARFPAGMGELPNMGIECPAVSQCTVLSSRTSQVVTFDPRNPGARSPVTLPAQSRLLECPATNLCVAQGVRIVGRDQQEAVLVTFDPAAPGNARQTAFPGAGFSSPIVCPSPRQCTVLGRQNTAATFDPTAPTITPASLGGDPRVAYDMACPSLSRCVGISDSQLVVFDPHQPGGARFTAIGSPGQIACLTPDRCFIASSNRNNPILKLTAFDPDSPDTALPTPARLTMTAGAPLRVTGTLRGVKSGARVKAELIKGKKVVKKVALRAGTDGTVVWKVGALRTGLYRIRLTAGRVVRTTTVTVSAAAGT